MVVVFINGEYWGVHFARESQNRDFFGRHHGLSPGTISILENDGELKAGDKWSYDEMIHFARSFDLADHENYNHLINMIDVGNFIDYHVLNLYSSNWDWPDRNVRLWSSEE